VATVATEKTETLPLPSPSSATTRSHPEEAYDAQLIKSKPRAPSHVLYYIFPDPHPSATANPAF